MPRESSHRRRSRHKQDSFTEFVSTESVTVPTLVRATDICFWLTFVGTAVCFAGRAANGQVVMVTGAVVTASCWLLHLLISSDRKYVWTGTEWLWCAGILVGIAQIVPMPQDWLLAISPRTRDVLPLWFSPEGAKLFPGGWNQLSLAPWESESGLATFVAYALLFVVAVQRMRTIADVEGMLRGAATSMVVMAAFALVQWIAGNGKYYWFYQHPFMTTDHTPHGCFTNHNHLGQFLALGSGPMIWWILRPSKSGYQSGFGDSSKTTNRIGSFLLLLGLVVSDLTVLLTTSRGGLLALGLATLITLTLFCRLGLASPRFVLGLVGAGTATAVIFFFTGYQSLAMRVDITADAGTKALGRLEVWQANLQVMNDFPIFGTGVGTHEDAHKLHLDVANQDGKIYTHAESSYLQVASESGIAGLTVMILMIATSTWWCIAALRNSEAQISSAAAAILGSLVANLCHAVGDFFWYTPSCVLLLAIQLACACRLAALTREASGRSVWTWSVPRPVVLVAGCSLAVVAVWMENTKLPGALAEADYMQFVTLARQEPSMDQEEQSELNEIRREAILRAARFNPHDSRILQFVADEYLEMFDSRKDEEAESPLSHIQIADVVSASEFKTQRELRDWLQRAVGRNTKLLHLSRKNSLRALRASPLRAYSYINLVEVGFLDVSGPPKEACLQQALKLGPNNPQILFAVGKNVLLGGDPPRALKYWKSAYHRSPLLREEITKSLVAHMTPESFLETFEPTWYALPPLAAAFGDVGKSEEARAIWQKCIEMGKGRLKTTLAASDLENVALVLRDAYFAIDDRDQGIRMVMKAQRQLPYSPELRARLGWDLYTAGRHAEAAEHLQWCAERSPGDEALQQAASIAIKARLKTANSDLMPDKS